MKKKIFILSGLFLLFIIWLVPAKFIENFIPPQKNITFSGFSGSAWSGEIDQVDMEKITLKEVAFSVSPFALLMAKLSVDLNITEGDVTGDLSVKLGSDYQSNIELNDVNLNIQASALEPFIPVKGSNISGVFESQNLDVLVKNKKLASIDGLGIWKNAEVTYSGQTWLLGEFGVEMSTDDKGTIRGKLLKTKNALSLEGDFTLTDKGVFEVIGSIATDSEQRLYQTFALFNNGKPSNGRLPIKFKQKVF